MRWKPIPDRVVIWALAPIAIPFVVVMLPVAGWVWMEMQFAKAIAAPKDWSPWFAWRPVRLNDWFSEPYGDWVWLERLERRQEHYQASKEYRLPSSETKQKIEVTSTGSAS